MGDARLYRQGCKRPAAYSRILHHLRAAGVTVFLVNEAYTSKRCSHCQSQDAECCGANVPGVLVRHGKGRFHRLKESHGRLICSGCGAMWNRDVNACHNMLIAASALLSQYSSDQLQHRSASHMSGFFLSVDEWFIHLLR